MKAWADSLEAVTPFLRDPHEASFVMSSTIALEIGGPNDNLARHTVSGSTGAKLKRGDLQAEVIERDDAFGVRIWSPSHSSIELRHRGLSKLCEISSSEIRLFPVPIAKKLEQAGIEPVLVKDWLFGTPLSDFNPHVSDYRSQMAELLNNDAFVYSTLILQKRMVFQTLHDVIEHATEASGAGWEKARKTASEVQSIFSEYFGVRGRGNIPSHILPFVIGVLVDDLVQSPFYGCPGRTAVIGELLGCLKRLEIDPQSPRVLKEFPSSIEMVLMMARKPGVENEPGLIVETVERLVKDLYRLTN